MYGGCLLCPLYPLLSKYIAHSPEVSVKIQTAFNQGTQTFTLICNTFIEGHPNFLQNIFLCCWNDLIPFLILCTNSRSRVSKTSRLKLKREVSWTEKRVQDVDYVFWSSTTFKRRKEWICESRCRQVSVHLRVFGGLFCP